MSRRPPVLALAALSLALLGACRQDTTVPPPAALTAEATAYFCEMAIDEMPGPKAQIALDGYPAPIFFGQVRDGVAYLKSPEQEARILAFYVTDMDKAEGWDKPGAENWIAADKAFYVVGADATGGMGTPEIVPFGTEAGAQGFAALHGGAVMTLSAIPAEAVLAPVDPDAMKGDGT